MDAEKMFRRVVYGLRNKIAEEGLEATPDEVQSVLDEILTEHIREHLPQPAASNPLLESEAIKRGLDPELVTVFGVLMVAVRERAGRGDRTAQDFLAKQRRRENLPSEYVQEEGE